MRLPEMFRLVNTVILLQLGARVPAHASEVLPTHIVLFVAASASSRAAT